jgi:hypothetical protein
MSLKGFMFPRTATGQALMNRLLLQIIHLEKEFVAELTTSEISDLNRLSGIILHTTEHRL